MWTDEQPRTRWVDPAVFRLRRPDLRLGAREQRPDRTDLVAGDRIAVRHTVRTSTAAYTLLLNAPEWLGRRGTGAALRDAVAELRAIDLTYGPNRPESLVSRLRRGEISPESYPPLRDLVDRCAAMRAATDGWFDAWACPAASTRARLRDAGSPRLRRAHRRDLVVTRPGGPWRVGRRDRGRARPRGRRRLRHRPVRAGPAGLAWFRPGSDYRVLFAAER